MWTALGGTNCTPSPGALVAGNSSIAVDVTGPNPANNPVPASGVSAVAVNVTAITTAAAGSLKVYQNGAAEPAQPNLYWTAGEVHAAMVIVPVDADGKIVLYAAQAVDVIVDVNGYFGAPTSQYNYTYDGDGLRRTKAWYGIGATYRYSLAEGLPMPIEENVFNGLLRTSYIYGPGGLPIEQITELFGSPTSKVWFHHDQIGSTRDLPGDWCFGTDADCHNPHNGHETSVSKPIVDFSSGVLDVNPITATTNALGFSDTGQYSDECSGWYRGGQVSMFAAEVAMGVGAGRSLLSRQGLELGASRQIGRSGSRGSWFVRAHVDDAVHRMDDGRLIGRHLQIDRWIKGVPDSNIPWHWELPKWFP
jgi:hypothetical protein